MYLGFVSPLRHEPPLRRAPSRPAPRIIPDLQIHPYFSPEAGILSGNQWIVPVAVCPAQRVETGNTGHQLISTNQIHDIFEGTEQIQQLVISRAISGLRIE